MARSPCFGAIRHHSLAAISRPHARLPQAYASNGARRGQHLRTGLLATTGIAGITLGIAMSTAPTIHCDSNDFAPVPPPQASPIPLQSAVNLYELSFGTLTGICAGVFAKKGAKMVAFFLGGVFVLLQYLNSISLVRVDWGRMASRFEDLSCTTDVSGGRRAPTFSSLWRRAVDFLTADFQPRASFIAGLALGLRLG